MSRTQQSGRGIYTTGGWPLWALVALLTAALVGPAVRPARASAEGRRNAILIGSAVLLGLLINAAEDNHQRGRG